MSRGPKQETLKESLPLHSIERARWTAILHPRLSHGGPQSRGKRKGKRPFFRDTPQVFVLSSARARGPWALSHRRNKSRITGQIYTYARRFKVRVFLARVSGDQLHLLVKSSDRKKLADFFRVLAGRVAISVTGAKRGVRKVGKFWNELCWSKLVNWGEEFYSLRRQIQGDAAPRAPWEERSADMLQGVLIPKTTAS